jgi:tetratricopeptide (TPR) repeat protein
LPDQALADLTQAVQLGMRTSGLYNDRGRAYAAKRQYDEAIAEYTEALRINSRDRVVYNNRGLAHANKGDHAKALADYNESLRLDPKYALAYSNRGNVHAELQQWDKALADFSRSMELGGDQSASVWTRAALARLARADRAGYRRYCAELMTRHGKTENVTAANNLAWCCALAPEAIADLKPAVQLAEQAVTKAPTNHAYRNTYGSILYRAGRYQEAVKELTTALEIHGKGGTPADWLFLAMAQHRLGRTEEAKQWLDKAVQSMQQVKPASWNARMEMQILRQEAEALCNAKATDPGE